MSSFSASGHITQNDVSDVDLNSEAIPSAASSDLNAHGKRTENEDGGDSSNKIHISSYDRSQANEDVDIFDAVLKLEEDFINEGFLEGRKMGLKTSMEEGIELGIDYGITIGEEIGFIIGLYQSIITQFLGVIQQQVESGDLDSRAIYDPPIPSDYVSIRQYNNDYFSLLLDVDHQKQLAQQLGFSGTKTKSLLGEMLHILSLAQSIQFIPGEDGDVDNITEIRSKTRAVMARLGVGNVFKNDHVIDF